MLMQPLPLLIFLALASSAADSGTSSEEAHAPALRRAYVQGSKHQQEDLADTGWGSPILIGTHHKTGTVLLAKIFRVAAKYMGVPRLKEAQITNRTQCSRYFASKEPVVCIVEHVSSRDLKAWVKPMVPFIHAVREPLEMCISAYQYHLTGAEPWLTVPLRDINNQTLQQYYIALPPEQAVNFECKRMMMELIEVALVYNATRARPKTLTVRLEEFVSNYDATTRRVFSFLGGDQSHINTLVNASITYDIARQPAGDSRHVSARSSKAALRAMVQRDPLVGRLMDHLRNLMGYGPGDTPEGPKREPLCSLVRKVCATTHVGFISWCTYGRVHPGRLPSLAECGDPSLTHSSRLRTVMAANPAMVDPSAPLPLPATSATTTSSRVLVESRPAAGTSTAMPERRSR